MKTAAILLLLLVGLLPLGADAHEELTNVLLVVQPEEILGFSGPRNRWVTQRLLLGEQIQAKRVSNNVAVVVTDRRLLGFSAFGGFWDVEGLRINEKIASLQAEGNVATVVTDQRVLAFNAHTGRWIKAY